jgi:60 kDa SS-A/Ro ribonucleoprotein
MARISQIYAQPTPQTEPADDNQVANTAGGYSFKIEDWDQLDRFLILGSEGGTYYIKPRQLTKENAKNAINLIKKDGKRVVDRIVEISEAGRAPRNDPALFVLALCVAEGDEDTRHYAYQNLSRVARIGTHLFTFVECVSSLGKGWGKGLRKAVARWYTEKSVDQLQYTAIKYKQRNGWSHRDLLRLSHAKPLNEQMDHVFYYMTKGELMPLDLAPEAPLPQIRAHASLSDDSTVAQVVRAIEEYRLPREGIPTKHLNSADVWNALLEVDMPMTALVRNLGKMTSVGLLKPSSSAVKIACAKLENEEAVRKSRIHPMQVLFALKTYASGGGFKGSLTWSPVTRITDALDNLFYTSFGNVEPTGKRMLLALDVSGSMSSPVMFESPITCAEASAAMAMVTARVEKEWEVMAFADGFRKISISPRQRMDDVLKMTERQNFGGTDCSLPMIWANQKGLEFDTFIVLTDSETYAGKMHPHEALNQYRKKTNIPAKLVVVAMTSNGFTIANPNDKGMLDVCGFDTGTPSVISDFVRN